MPPTDPQHPEPGFSTRAIHAGQDADPATGATVVPIYATSTYTQAAPGQHKGYEYSRSGNPTRTALETALAALEEGERGLAFASGLAATTAVFAALLRPGDEVAASADLYGGSFRLLEPVKFYQNAAGGVPGPFDAYLTLRGLKTLAVRMDRHCDNAVSLASWLVKQPQVARVYYPGLPDHPGHAVARRQMRGFGGMMSLKLHGGADAARRFITRTKLFSLAESLGGVESLVGHPATMTHASIPREVREARGLVRLSVGIEDAADLRADLQHALAGG